MIPYRALVWGWESKPTSPFLHFPFPRTETNSFHRGRSCGRTMRELTNLSYPCVRTVLGALDSLESFKVNKLAFLTKARLSFGIYPHRVLQQHSYRQAPIGARSSFWAGKCSSLAVPSARETLDQKVGEQSSPCPARFLICGSPNWLLGCGRTGGGQSRPMA